MALIIAIAVAFMFSKKPPETRSTVWKMSLEHEIDFEKSQFNKILIPKIFGIRLEDSLQVKC